jgi:hypothetical protein
LILYYEIVSSCKWWRSGLQKGRVLRKGISAATALLFIMLYLYRMIAERFVFDVEMRPPPTDRVNLISSDVINVRLQVVPAKKRKSLALNFSPHCTTTTTLLVHRREL